MAEVHLSGPWFDEAGQIINELVDECVHAVSGQAEMDWKAALKENLKHPTGAYESRINVLHGSHTDTLNDDASKYGPWLEGTGSRNAPRTRFEGYHSMQDVVDALPDKIDTICQPAVDAAIGALNE